MKLFVDDIRNAPDESWTVARTVNSAIKAIHQFHFEEISLDHDISHQVHMDELSRPYPCLETFQAVAHYIGMKYWTSLELDKLEPVAEKQGIKLARPKLYPKITLHTSNVVGAAEMEAILAGYGLKSEKKLMGLANRLEMEV